MLSRIGNIVFKTGNRQHEFDKLYSIDSDPWDYRGSLCFSALYFRNIISCEIYVSE